MKLFKNQHGMGMTVLIIVAAVAIAGVGFISWNAYRSNKQADEKVEVKTGPTATENNQTTNTLEDTAIVDAVKAYLKTYNEVTEADIMTYEFNIVRHEGSYAAVSAGKGGAGGRVYVVKKNGVWKGVWDGQNVPPQCLKEAGFPANWYSSEPTGYENSCHI